MGNFFSPALYYTIQAVTKKALIRLCGCAYGINRFPHDMAHFKVVLMPSANLSSNVATVPNLSYCFYIKFRTQFLSILCIDEKVTHTQKHFIVNCTGPYKKSLRYVAG